MMWQKIWLERKYFFNNCFSDAIWFWWKSELCNPFLITQLGIWRFPNNTCWRVFGILGWSCAFYSLMQNSLAYLYLCEVFNSSCVFQSRCCYLYALCWPTQIPMIHLCLKSLTCTRLTGQSMRPPPVAGHRSMRWVDAMMQKNPFSKF